jgi:hypothetical protein
VEQIKLDHEEHMPSSQCTELPRSKPRVSVAAFVLFFCFLPSIATAEDSWDEYRRFLDGYYLLDKQPVSSITCRISVPVLEKKLNAIRLPIDGSVKETENIRDFSVTYDKVKGISFVTPEIDMEIVSSSNMRDPDAVQQGIDLMKKGFSGLEHWTESVVSYVIREDMASPNRAQLKNLSFSTKDGATHVSYLWGDKTCIHNYSGKLRKSKITSPSRAIDENAEFTLVKGKLVLVKSVSNENAGSKKTNTTLQVEYQDLGKALFLSRISTDISSGDGASSRESRLEISFKDCQVNGK